MLYIYYGIVGIFYMIRLKIIMLVVAIRVIVIVKNKAIVACIPIVLVIVV